MIKKVLLSAALCILAAIGVSAQKFEVMASYGAYTQMDAMGMKDGWRGVNTAWGAVNIGSNFRLTQNIWLGSSYTFSSTTTKESPEHSSIAYHAIMMNGRYHYYSNNIVSLYGKLGLGVEISRMQPLVGDSYNKTYCAFQIVPVGAQVDIYKGLAMFAEAGFGAQGLFQFGFKYQL